MTSVAMALYGTAQPVAPRRRLTAGAWSCDWSEGQLHNVCWNGVEVVRGISFLLRDEDWGTVPAELKSLQVDEHSTAFQVRFQLMMSTKEGRLTCEGTVQANADGQLMFEVIAQADRQMITNRCGFVVLHPASAAGSALEVEHTDGRCSQTVFPAQISPSQPVFDIRELRYAPVPETSVAIRLDAQLPHDPAGKFEMEDQRNWSDASFKTYVASLLDAWPYTLPAGQPLSQRVTVRATGQGPRDDHHAFDESAQLSLGQPSQACFPALGIGVPMGLDKARQVEIHALRLLPVDWWIAEMDLRECSAEAQILALAKCRAGLGIRIQLDVIVPDTMAPDKVVEHLAQMCDRARLVPEALRMLPAALLKSFQPSDRWPALPQLEAYAQAARVRFPDAQVGGGMFTSFTELNRKRPAGQSLDFIGHLTCPIVHAADDVSVMETIEALPHITRSVRSIWPELPYRLGPSTLAPRRNPYGDGTASNPQLLRRALAARDPRHGAAFGGAWVAAYAAAVAFESLEVLALLESHGPNGPFPVTDGGRSQPNDEAQAVAAWQVLGKLAGASGAQLIPLDGLRKQIRGLAWSHDGSRVTVLLANVTDQSATYRWTDLADRQLGRTEELAAFEVTILSIDL